MNKSDLLKRIKDFPENAPVIIGDAELGWTNLGEIKNEAGTICLMPDYSLPFNDE
jgi:hypothetical protein